MDEKLLLAFAAQVEAQCYFGIVAYHAISNKYVDNYRRFYDLQNFVNSAANLSKIFWKREKKKLIPREHLIAEFKVTDESPIKATGLRNNCEHIDERLETWWHESLTKNYVDFTSDSKIAIATDYKDFFRYYDSQTQVLSFWSDRIELVPVHREMIRLHDLAVEINDRY